jgi:hypothetical protein
LRRHWKVAFAVASFAVTTGVATRPAQAAPMDPAPDRLYMDPSNMPQGVAGGCQTVASNPNIVLSAPFPSGAKPGNYACVPNNVSWANMMSELGYAIAPSAFHPARTTGFGGFTLSLEASFAHINANSQDSTGTYYWQAGTQGDKNPNNGAFSGVNKYPDSILQIYTLKARKGLPFGLEITGALGYIANTSLWLGGADVHWAILEGFRTGILGYLPDMAIGGGVRTVGGASSFFLTTVGIDGQLSKPFVLGDSAVITPYVGVQRLIIWADSTVVNLTPTVDPLQQCGYEGTNVKGNPYAPGNANGIYDGQPVCSNKLSNGLPNNGAFNNLVTFQKDTIDRWRGIIGLIYRYEILHIGGQVAFDVENPSVENGNLGVSGAKQWTMSFEAGVSF